MVLTRVPMSIVEILVVTKKTEITVGVKSIRVDMDAFKVCAEMNF